MSHGRDRDVEALQPGTRTTDRIGNLFGVATYCEGDVKTTCYRTQRAQWEAITEHAYVALPFVQG